jgi:hypothetical protein
MMTFFGVLVIDESTGTETLDTDLTTTTSGTICAFRSDHSELNAHWM